MPVNEIPFSGAVLAGGQSRRMGRPKAELEVRGERLLDRQLRLFEEIGIRDRLISLPHPTVGPGLSLVTDSLDVRRIADPVPACGPLAGIVAVLEAARHPMVLMLAVDLPSVSAEWLCHLVDESRRSGSGIVPLLDGRHEPLLAIYPIEALASARDRLENGSLALQDWVKAQLGSTPAMLRSIEVPDSFRGCFANWNTPEDFGGKRLTVGF
jgi:molybdenum cofactor guanylyltransferase